MKLINQSIEVLTTQEEIDLMLKRIEQAGRLCYKSEDRITEDSWKNFISSIINKGHLSVIEHMSLSVRIITNRAISHEIVRHRTGIYSQESTRYCSYDKDKFGNEITLIDPFTDLYNKNQDAQFNLWKNAMEKIENTYFQLLKNGATAQEARGILPNDLKTEIIMTMNLRNWRHFLKLRMNKSSHPQIREIAYMIYENFNILMPIIFKDI